MTAPGYISSNELYRLAEAKRRLNMGRHSFRLLREVGLPLWKVGRCVYVNGSDVIEAMQRAAEQQAGKGGGGDE